MENIILHSTPLGDFQTIIGNIVRDELKKFQPEPNKPATETEYLTRKEVCKRLRISLSTLHYYTKDGILRGYRIGGRILYKTAEVNSALQEIQSLKYKHRP